MMSPDKEESVKSMSLGFLAMHKLTRNMTRKRQKSCEMQSNSISYSVYGLITSHSSDSMLSFLFLSDGNEALVPILDVV